MRHRAGSPCRRHGDRHRGDHAHRLAELGARHLGAISGEPLAETHDRIEASSELGARVTVSGVLERIAVKLSRICNDLRLLSRAIMPGKANRVIPEVVDQVA